MKEIIDILNNAARLLRELETETPFVTMIEELRAKVYLSHGAINLAKSKLHLLHTQEAANATIARSRETPG